MVNFAFGSKRGSLTLVRFGHESDGFLSPDQHGTILQATHMNLIAGLQAIPSAEVGWIDARDRTANGLLLADFFDFT